MHLNELALKIRTAGDLSRIKILCVLFRHKNRCVSDVAVDLHMSVAIVSHHLKVMESRGLVRSVRNGKRICYGIPDTSFAGDMKKLICKYK